jgi:hypothetical protein
VTLLRLVGPRPASAHGVTSGPAASKSFISTSARARTMARTTQRVAPRTSAPARVLHRRVAAAEPPGRGAPGHGTHGTSPQSTDDQPSHAKPIHQRTRKKARHFTSAHAQSRHARSATFAINASTAPRRYLQPADAGLGHADHHAGDGARGPLSGGEVKHQRLFLLVFHHLGE